MQPTPTVTRADVERIARREFGEERFAEVMAILDEYDDRERERVQVDAMKLAAGDLDALRRQIAWGRADWRDVLGPAEYKRYGTKKFDRATPEEQQRLIDLDWQEYSDWFSK